jgi:CheY-like chemotaxis protein
MARLLWAEDSPDDQALIRAALSNMLHVPEVEFVSDGVALLEKAAADPRPGLIVLDLGMPRMDGMETLARLQAAGNRVGVIVFTGHDGPGEERQCRSRGAAEVIQKPTGYWEFVAAVQRIVTHSAWTLSDSEALAVAVPSP